MLTRPLSNKDERSSSETYSTSIGTKLVPSLRCTRHDAAPIILAILSFFICLTACLVSYFVVRRSDLGQSKNALDAIKTSSMLTLQASLNSAYTTVKAYGDFFQYSKSVDIDYSSQFVPLLNAQGGFSPLLSGVYFAKRVKREDVTAFSASVRAKGGPFSFFYPYQDFTFTSSGFGILPLSPNKTEYFLITLGALPPQDYKTYGLDSSTYIPFLGWDWNNPINGDAIVRANRTKKPAVTPFAYFPTNDTIPLSYGTTVVGMVPVLNTTTNEVQGVIGATILIETIIRSALSDKSLSSVLVTVYDTRSLNDSNGGLVFASNKYANKTNVQPLIDQALFSTQGTLQFIDTNFTVMFTPQGSFVDDNSGILRYTGIIVSIIVFLILIALCIAMFFLNKLRLSLRQRAQSKRRLETLKDSHERTTGLLERLVKQEAKARATIDAFPDYFVILLNRSGRVVQTNRNFDDMFGFSPLQLENGLSAFLLFTSLNSTFFTNQAYLSSTTQDRFLEAKATTNEGKEIDVIFIIKSILVHGHSDAPVDDDKRSSNENIKELEENEESFVLIGRAKQMPEREIIKLDK